MRRPNFFMVGAPKCGTTALSEYLRTHPQVFLSPHKEPNYFCEDLPGVRLTTTEKEYLRLFEGTTDRHIAVGEASIRYMYSKVAIANLYRFAPDARLVVMLRNPVELAYSFHSQALYSVHEDVPDFRTAWDLQEARARGEHIPKGCREPAMLQYRAVAMLGTQLQRVLEYYPREQIFIRLVDDLAADTKRVYEDLLLFLGVPSDGRTEFPRINENKERKSRALARLTEKTPRVWQEARRVIYGALGIHSIGFLEPLRRWNAVPVKRPPLDPEFRARLVEEFRGDVEVLARLIDRDLSSWLRHEPAVTRS